MPRKMGREDGMCDCRHCRRGGIGKLLFGIFLLLIGLSWLGNDLGWWRMSLPWIPLAFVLLAVGLIVGWALKRGRND